MIHLRVLFTVVILACLFLANPVQTVSSPSSTLLDHYDDGSEMNQRIILEFIASPVCQKECHSLRREELLNAFEEYRGDWVQKMINFVISELGLDTESAQQVRKNPSNYLVNY